MARRNPWKKNPKVIKAAQAGGIARSKKMTKKERSESARYAINKRWEKRSVPTKSTALSPEKNCKK